MIFCEGSGGAGDEMYTVICMSAGSREKLTIFEDEHES